MHTKLVDLRDFDRRAVQASVAVVKRVRPEDLDRPTPCAEWTLADLLAHMTVQHRGFRAASLGLGADLKQWTPTTAADPVADYEAAADAVLAAFGPSSGPDSGSGSGPDSASLSASGVGSDLGSDSVLERRFALPEISTTLEFPGAQAIGFHFIDYVVHGWDVARALGEGYELDDDLAAAALRVAQAVPNGPERGLPTAAFRPGLPVGSQATLLERILLLLGRSPNWPDTLASS